MHDVFLAKLSKAIRTFMTESQCVDTINHVRNAVKNTWETYEATHRSFKKKRKTDMEVDEPQPQPGFSEDEAEAAVVFALVSRLASVVLSSLPTQSLSAATLEQVRASVLDFRSEVVHHALLKCLKALKNKKGKEEDTWPIEVCLSGILRLLYAMNVSKNLSLPSGVDVYSKLKDLLTGSDLLPELVVEVVSTWLLSF